MGKLATCVPLPLRPGAAVLTCGRFGFQALTERGQTWAAWLGMKMLIFCVLNVSLDSVNGRLQLR